MPLTGSTSGAILPLADAVNTRLEPTMKVMRISTLLLAAACALSSPASASDVVIEGMGFTYTGSNPDGSANWVSDDGDKMSVTYDEARSYGMTPAQMKRWYPKAAAEAEAKERRAAVPQTGAKKSAGAVAAAPAQARPTPSQPAPQDQGGPLFVTGACPVASDCRAKPLPEGPPVLKAGERISQMPNGLIWVVDANGYPQYLIGKTDPIETTNPNYTKPYMTITGK
jgi:hypothetical protein